jgi:hypothetical protein
VPKKQTGFKIAVKGIEWDTEVDGEIQHPRLPKNRTWVSDKSWLLDGGKPDGNTPQPDSGYAL